MKTFDDWSRLGYRIRKGAKSLARSPSGVPLFDRTQVWNPYDYSSRRVASRQSPDQYRTYNMSREEDYDMAVAYMGDRDWF